MIDTHSVFLGVNAPIWQGSGGYNAESVVR